MSCIRYHWIKLYSPALKNLDLLVYSELVVNNSKKNNTIVVLKTT